MKNFILYALPLTLIAAATTIAVHIIKRKRHIIVDISRNIEETNESATSEI